MRNEVRMVLDSLSKTQKLGMVGILATIALVAVIGRQRELLIIGEFMLLRGVHATEGDFMLQRGSSC